MTVKKFLTYRSKSVLLARKELFDAVKAKQDTTILKKKLKDALDLEIINKKSLVIGGSNDLEAWSKAEYTAISGQWSRGLHKNAYALFIRSDSVAGDGITLDPYVFALGVLLEYSSVENFNLDETFSIFPADSETTPGVYDAVSNCRLAQGGFGSALDSDGIGTSVLIDAENDDFNSLTFSEYQMITAGLGIDQTKFKVILDTAGSATFNSSVIGFLGTPEECVKGQKTLLVDVTNSPDVGGDYQYVTNALTYDLNLAEKVAEKEKMSTASLVFFIILGVLGTLVLAKLYLDSRK